MATEKISCENFYESIKEIEVEYQKAKNTIQKAPRLGEIGYLVRQNGFFCSYDGFSCCSFFGRYAYFSASNYESKWVLSSKVDFNVSGGNRYKIDMNDTFVHDSTVLRSIEKIYNGIIDITEKENPYEDVLPISDKIKEILVVPDVPGLNAFENSVMDDKFEIRNSRYQIFYEICGKKIQFFVHQGGFGRLFIEEKVLIDGKCLDVTKSVYFINSKAEEHLTPREREELFPEKDTWEYKIYSEGRRTIDHICNVVGFEAAKKKAYEIAKQKIECGKRRKDMCSRHYHSCPIDTSDKVLDICSYEFYNYDGSYYWISVNREYV